MALIGSSSRTDQHFYDESDNSVDLSDNSYQQDQESGGDSFYVSGFGTDFSVIDGGAFNVVSDMAKSLERVFISALDFAGGQNDEVLNFAGDVYTESANLAGQATVGANFSTTAVSKNLMYVAGAAALLFVASKVFK